MTLDEELEDSRWVDYSGGLRCPFNRRTGSDRCAHHDPREGELCGYPLDDGGTCTTPQGVFACCDHRYARLAHFKRKLEQLPLTLDCSYCDAASGTSCTNGNGRAVAFHKKRVNALQGSEEHRELSDTIKWLSL
ncbi:zinc finger domain-containing protein [Streptomyces griseoincarnatus]